MVVADGENAEATAGFLGDDRGQRRGGGRVEHRGHLVANQVARPLDESARKAGALELPVGHLVGTAGEEIVGQPDSLRGGVDGVGATAAGDYTLVIEAAREVGGRELLRIPFTWPAKAGVGVRAAGKTELGAVTVAFR